MPTRSVGAVGPVDNAAPASQAPGASDVVEISSIAKLAAKIHELPDVRAELVEKVKTEIASGEYETPQRIELTIDRLMDELFPGM